MSDWAHDWTDDRIDELERRFASAYSQAAREMREKLAKSFADQQEAQKTWRERVRSGEATSEEYKKWLRGRANDRKFISGLAQTLADDASRANQLARDYINDEIPRVYAENANFAAYGIEREIGYDTHSFDLYDQSTVRRLIGLSEHDQIIHEVIPVGPPRPELQSLRVNLDAAKDVRWNRQKFTSAITQSILQGESVPNAAKRLMVVLNMDRGMAVRAARTAMTSAENAGRVDSYKRAERIGIRLEQQWMATLDERTRYSHRELDGQHVPVGKKFVAKSTGHEIEFPGDPKAHPSETYNCFVGDTLVCADTEIERSYKHEYSGDLLTIKTASGIEFTCTPNHPILTPCGWVVANLLHEGDDLCIARVGDGRLSGVNPDVHHVQASMETVHDLLSLSSTKRIACSHVNFHGDVPTSDVEIVGEEGPLRFYGDSSRGEGIAELALKDADTSGLCGGTSCEGFRSSATAATSVLGSESIQLPFLGGELTHPDVHGIGTIAPFNSSIAKNASNDVSGMPDAFGDCFLGLTTEIGVDHIINVEVTYTRGTHVYNLQTSDGYYFVGSEDTDNVIIAHNCRCTLVAWSPEMEAEDANTKRFTRLPKGMTYEQWKGAKKGNNNESGKNDSSQQAVQDIGTKPVRPRKSDFDDMDEYRDARAKYREEKSEFEKKKSELRDEILSMPDHGYVTEESILSWAGKTGAHVTRDALENIDARILDESIYTLDKMFAKYPQVLSFYESIGRKFTIDIDRGSGAVMEASGGLNISARHIPTYARAIENTIDSYTSVEYNEHLQRSMRFTIRGDGTFATQVTHEFGHNLDHAISQRFVAVDEFGETTLNGKWDEYKRELAEVTKRHTTSSYSLTTHSEAFAEGFAEHECNPQSEYAIAFGKFLERWL